jgi:hypothetical protein
MLMVVTEFQVYKEHSFFFLQMTSTHSLALQLNNLG